MAADNEKLKKSIEAKDVLFGGDRVGVKVSILILSRVHLLAGAAILLLPSRGGGRDARRGDGVHGGGRLFRSQSL